MAKIHIHTKYSLLDAIIEPEELVKKVKEQDGDNAALCVTEHGNLYSAVELYKLCKKYNVKYILGCEAYICDDVNVRDKNNKYYHLVIIAKNEVGRLNMNKLISESCKYKYYGKPRIDFNLLCKYKEGLIVTSACMAGEIQRFIIDKDINKLKETILKYKKVFGDDYYLEYQSHSEPTQQKLNKQIVNIAKKFKVKFIVTTDAHYLIKDDQKYHSIFVGIGQSREVGETYNDCYVQSDEEILRICKSTSEEDNLLALQTTNEIANKCTVDLPLSAPIMPHVSIPKEFSTEFDYLKYLCKQGWKTKKIYKKQNVQEYKERLVYELTSIKKMGFEGYFLLVHSYCNSVHRRGIARGSAGGSLVCYLSNITDIDPIEFGLYFERFIDVGSLELLGKGLISPSELKIPDVDSDFGKQDREKVLQFVINKYGEERVVSLGSFQYIWAKGAIKDIGRVLGIPFEETNQMTSNLDKETIKEALDLGLLDQYKNKYPKLFEYAERLAGLPKSFSAHPCGKVIAMDEVTYYNAVDINDDGTAILEGDMHTADDLGLIKADFLGLRTVDIIYDTLEMIGKDYEYIAPHNLNLNDKKVLNEFKQGHTSQIFQFESLGMQDTLKKIECDSLYDIIVANALYRPGSMKYIDNYANRKKGLEEYTYLHKDLEPILKDSYSIIIFQEQLIEIGRLAGLSNPDELRKATAKKKASLLNKIKPELFNGLLKRGWSEEQLNILWEMMLDFAKYSFNKSHSAAYALIAYICMYLKVYHTKEFMISVLNSITDKPEKIPEAINEIKRLQIPIYIGKYNDCYSICRCYNDGIIIGTKLIKFCNAQIAEELCSLKIDKCLSFVDLLPQILEQTSINSRQLEILIKLNFFSDYGENEYLLKIVDLYKKIAIRKTFKKAEISKMGIPENLMKMYAAHETEKQYTQVNTIGLVNDLVKDLVNKSLPVGEQLKAEQEYLGYCTTIYEDIDDELYICNTYETYSNPTNPYITVRQLRTGQETKTKVKSKIYTTRPFGLWSILKIDHFDYEFKKKKNSDGKWVNTDELKPVLNSYEVIKNEK